jgi:CheY-like chemotaxis protein
MPEQATILVVDDLPRNVRLLESILAPRGYRVVAANRTEAREHVAAEPVDLVLLDILMPRCTGTRCAEPCAPSRPRAPAV